MGIIVRKLGHLIDLKTLGIRDDEIEKVIKQWLIDENPCDYVKGSGKPMTVGEVITYLKDHMFEIWDDFNDDSNWEHKGSSGGSTWAIVDNALKLTTKGGATDFIAVGTKLPFSNAVQIRVEFWLKVSVYGEINRPKGSIAFDDYPQSGKFGIMTLFDYSYGFDWTKHRVIFYHSGGKSYGRIDKLINGNWVKGSPIELESTQRIGKTYLWFHFLRATESPYHHMYVKNLRVWRKETSG